MNASNKTKAMWNIVKNATTSTRKCVENVILKDKNKEVKDPETIASLFNQYFSRIAFDLTQGLTSPNSNADVSQKTFNTMFVSEASSNEILRIVAKLKNKYSAGLDDFPDILLNNFLFLRLFIH